MSPLPRWPNALFVGASLATVALSGLVNNWFIALPFLAVFFVGWFYGTRIRCPRCRRRLHSHGVSLDAKNTKHQMYYDCPDCRVTWDPDVTIYRD